MPHDMRAMTTNRYLSIPILSISILSILIAAAPTPDRVVELRTSDVPALRDPALFRKTMLDGHNAARSAVGVPPLVWDESLAGAAAGYAQHLAETRRFAHAQQPQGPGFQGENLWTGTRDAFSYREMVGYWVDERRHFVNAETPMFSRTGRWQDVGHYTEIVWRGTTAVGCATASNDSDDYLVCRYSPAGNVVGERAF